MSRPRKLTLRLAGAALAVAPALAHDGPPYPILVDEVLEGWTVSVWSDPDVGTGTFYYYIDPPADHGAGELSILVTATPADGASPPVEGRSELARPHEPFQQIGTLEFHHRGVWQACFVLSAPGADGALLGELTFDLHVTPPGLGVFNLLWFAFPFVVLGGLWLRGLLAQRAYDRANPSPSPDEA